MSSSGCDNCKALQSRIDRAVAILQSAPDIINDDTSKRLARDVSTANRIAWAILTEGVHPESVRYARNVD